MEGVTACVCCRRATTYLTYRLCVKSHPLHMAARFVASLIYSWPPNLATPPPQHRCRSREYRSAPSLFSCSLASAEPNEVLFWGRNCGFRLCFCPFQVSRRRRQHQWMVVGSRHKPRNPKCHRFESSLWLLGVFNFSFRCCVVNMDRTSLKMHTWFE